MIIIILTSCLPKQLKSRAADPGIPISPLPSRVNKAISDIDVTPVICLPLSAVFSLLISVPGKS